MNESTQQTTVEFFKVMSNSNFHRARPQSTRYSNNYDSSRVTYDHHFDSNQQSPVPLLGPSSQQPMFPSQERFHSNHAHQSNNRPFHHTENHLSNRMWSNTEYQEYFRRHYQQHFKIHIVCYNILAQSLLEDNQFLYMNCLRNNLQWHRRKERLLREILRQDADIVCLQEMENFHYENEFRPKFMEYGYDSIYLKRNGSKSDGCCIFYKIKRLRLMGSKAVPFYQKDIRILDRDNCGLIALFQPIHPETSSDDLFCVATTHLLFSPKRGDIKLAQLQYFLAEVDRLATRDHPTGCYYPIILCGDFNAQPQCPLIQFLLNQYIKYDSFRCIDISGQTPSSVVDDCFSHPLPSNELLPLSFVTSDCRLATLNDDLVFEKHANQQQSSAILTHNKQLLSVYDSNDMLDVTTNAGDEAHLVDYIFYSQQENDPYRLNLLSRYDLYKQDEVINVHMPNHQFASDHFMLAAKFALKLRKTNVVHQQ
ncbi:unnamed protein product [Rotaria socialis]